METLTTTTEKILILFSAYLGFMGCIMHFSRFSATYFGEGPEDCPDTLYSIFKPFVNSFRYFRGLVSVITLIISVPLTGIWYGLIIPLVWLVLPHEEKEEEKK